MSRQQLRLIDSLFSLREKAREICTRASASKRGTVVAGSLSGIPPALSQKESRNATCHENKSDLAVISAVLQKVIDAVCIDYVVFTHDRLLSEIVLKFILVSTCHNEVLTF